MSRLFSKGVHNFFVLNFLLKYAFLRYALPVKYAIFSRKSLCLNSFFLLRNKIKHISSNGKILCIFIYFTVLSLDKLKLKEPGKNIFIMKSLL